MDDAAPDIFASPKETAPPNIFDEGPKAPDIDAPGLALIDHIDSNPDQEAKIKDLSARSGLPREAVKVDPTSVQREVEFREAQDIMNYSPPLQRYIKESPENLGIIKDDLPQLSTFGDALVDFGKAAYAGTAGAFVSGWQSGQLSNEMGREGYNLLTAKTLGGDTSVSEAKLKDLQLEMKHFPNDPGLIGKFGGLAGGLLDNLLHSGASALAGMGIGVASTAWSGPGAAAGATAGAIGGTMSGMGGDAWKVAAGQTYVRLGEEKDDQGNPISEPLKIAAAQSVGLGVGLLNMIGIKTVGSFAGEALQKAISESAVKMAVNPTVSRAVMSGVRSVAEGAATGAFINTGMNAINITGDTIASIMAGWQNDSTFPTVFNDPKKVDAVMEQLYTGLVDGAVLFGALKLPAAGRNLVADVTRAQHAGEAASKFEELFQQSRQTKVFQRDPEVLASYIRSMNDNKVSIPVQVVLDLYGQQADGTGGTVLGAKDGPLGYVKNLEAQVRAAQANGGDIRIGVADYFAYTDPAVHEKLSQHLRQNPEGFTPAEAANVNPADYAQQLFHGNGIGPFKNFDSAFMGTGEGAQAFGYGHYFAENQKIAKSYYDKLSSTDRYVGEEPLDTNKPDHIAAQYLHEARGDYEKARVNLNDDIRYGSLTNPQTGMQALPLLENKTQLAPVEDRPTGTMYTVKVNRPKEDFIHQDLDLNSQPPKVKAALEKLGVKQKDDGLYITDKHGNEIWAGDNLHDVRSALEHNNSQMSGYKFADGSYADASNPQHEAGMHVADGMRNGMTEEEAVQAAIQYVERDHERAENEYHDRRQQLEDLNNDPEHVINNLYHPQIKTEADARSFISNWIDGSKRKMEEADAVKSELVTGLYAKDLTWDPGMKPGEVSKQLSATLEKEGIAGYRFYDNGTRRRADTIKILRDNLKGEEEVLAEFTNGRSQDAFAGNGKYNKMVTDQQKLVDEARQKLADAEADLAKRGETHNAVVFRDEDIEITHVNGVEIPKPLLEHDPFAEQVADAAGDAIEAQRKALWLDPIFEAGDAKAKIPNALGMTKQQFELYSKHLQAVQKAITTKVFNAVETEIARRETKLWKDAVAQHVIAVRDEFRGNGIDDGRPLVHMADWALRANENPKGEKLPFPIKLDPNAVDVIYGGVDKRAGMNDSWFATKGGFHPDDIAKQFGFDTGKELTDALASLESDRQASGKTPRAYFDGLVKEEATKRVEGDLGKLDERILKQALEAALDVKQIEVLVDETLNLGHAIGEDKITKDLMIEQAKSDHGSLPIEDARNHELFERQTAKFGREAEMALLKGDVATAFQAKQKQLLNFLMMREARKFNTEMERLQTQLDRFGTQRVVEQVAQKFTDQIHTLMERLDVPTPRSGDNLTKATGGRALPDFQTEVRDTTGKEVYVAEILHNPHDETYLPPALKNMNAAQAREVAKTIQSLYEIGRNEQMVITETAKFERELMVTDAVNAVGDATGNKEIDYQRTGPQGIGKRTKRFFRAVDATLLKTEQLFQWLDQGHTGPFNQLFKMMKDAQFYQNDKMKWLGAEFSKLRDASVFHNKDMLVPNQTLLDERGRPVKLTRANMMAMALNIGNEGNLEILAKGRGWDANAIHDFLNNNMTKQEWNFVKGVWGITDKLWPEVERVTKELSGVAIEEVKGRLVKTPYGDIKGGYYPLIKDDMKELQQGNTTRQKTDGLFDNRFFNPFADASAMHERTGAVYPVALDFDSLPSRLVELVHGLAFRGPISEVQKVLLDPRVNKAIADGFGPEYQKQLRPWLQDIANNGFLNDRRPYNAFVKVLQEAKSNVIGTLIGLRMTTGFVHGGAAAMNSMGELPPGAMLREVHRSLASLSNGDISRFKEALEQSGELRNRGHNISEDLGYQMDKMMMDPSPRRQVLAWSGVMVSMLDQLTAIPTFIAARDHALEAGKSMDEAIYIGEQVTRNAHGANGLVDLPAVQRSDALRWSTLFYGTFNHNYNRLRDTGRIAGAGAYGQAVWRTMMYLIGPALLHQHFRPHAPNKEDKGDDSFWDHVPASMLIQATSGIPLVRELAYAGVNGYMGHPIYQGAETAIKGTKDLYHIIKGDDKESAKWISNVIMGTGFLTGMGNSIFAGWAQSAYDINKGTLDFNDVDWFNLATDGKPKKKGSE